MKKKQILSSILLLIVFSGLFANCVFPQKMVTKALTDRTAKSPTWALIWHDEFNESAPLQENWYIDINDYGGGNQELQYYTDRTENVHIKDGMLHIVGLREDYLTREYTSARLTTQDAWTYGRFEIRAKLPEGQGIWPAIWLISDTEPYGSWPTSGEVDIMEMLGHEPNIIYGTLHYTNPQSEHAQFQGAATLSPGEFHTFALEWDENEFRFFVDGEQYFTVDAWDSDVGAFPAPYDQPFNIIVNLAIGGTWPGSPNEDTIFPQDFLIDYVRVYQRGE